MIINLDSHRKTEPAVVHADRKLTVLGHDYTARRSSMNGRIGWISVKDARGQMLFVRAGDLPDSVLVDLIGCWMDGYSVGRREAARAAARGTTGDIV